MAEHVREEQSVKTYITPKEAGDLLGVSGRTLAIWARTIPGFPKPARVTSRCLRWDRHALLCWMRERSEATEGAGHVS